MHISPSSLHFVNHYAKSAAPATAASLPAAASEAADSSHGLEADPRARSTNRLTLALSAALREIGIGGLPAQAGAPATTGTPANTGSAAAPAATPPAAGELNAAVAQFASALMDALGAGRSARGRSGEHRQDGEHGHHGQGGRDNRYGDLAQRLESLSKTVLQVPPTAQAPSDPSTPAAPVTEAPISVAPVDDSDIAPAAPAPAPAPAAPAATRSALSPLLQAFTKLFDALTPPAPAHAPATDMASRLQQFLHTMAQALSRNGLDSAMALQSGAFIDVKA